ncbi:MAG: FtsH-binding integral membrane protein [Polaribacter sp.]|jgi:FtsH-binding integral membrane protein
MEKEESVIKYEIRQTNLKKVVKKLKKKIPYFIFIFIFFGIALIILLEGVLNKFLGNNSYNLILIISAFFILLSLGYIIMMLLKIKSFNKEIKSLGEKMYHKMKL